MDHFLQAHLRRIPPPLEASHRRLASAETEGTMAAASPGDLHSLWAEGVNRGDLDGLMELYEPDAVFVAQPGTVVSGGVAIREALSGILSLSPRISMESDTVATECGSLATIMTRWSLAGTGPDGSAVSLGAVASDVCRQQPDGSWQFVIDNPWGDSALGS
jgi:uncharacterized protein (TIGR02246 family)